MKMMQTYDNIVDFINSFISALCPNAVAAFKVDVVKNGRNRFFFGCMPDKVTFYKLRYNYHDKQLSYYNTGNIGTFGKIDKLFINKYPRLMLRPGFIALDELADEFGFCKEELARIVFTGLNDIIDLYNKSHKISFFLTDDFMNVKLATPYVDSIEELIIWADVKVEGMPQHHAR